jgi:nitroreductase
MKLDQAMQERRSIRGFLDKPVSRALLEEVIALANRAPSSMNTQPWHLHVLTGEPLETGPQGQHRTHAASRRGEITPTEHRKRQIESAAVRSRIAILGDAGLSPAMRRSRW